MFYKTKELNFQTDGVGIENLCKHNNYYYLNSPHEIPECEEVSGDEFNEAIDNVVHANEPIESEPTQLDLIQSSIEKSNNELRQEGADALMLELINKNII